MRKRGKADFSTRSVERPAARVRRAALAPAGPAPMTRTSKDEKEGVTVVVGNVKKATRKSEGQACRRRRVYRGEARAWYGGRMSMSKNGRLILAGVAALVFGGLAWVLWGEALRAMMEEVMGILREAGPVVFFGAMALLPLAGFPLSPFTVAAGPVFGPQMGVVAVIGCAIVAVAVNVTVACWLAARGVRPLVMWGLAELGRGLPAVAARSGWELTLILRVVPGTPFFLQSYLLGVARVRFGIYLLISVSVPAVY